MQIEEGKFYVRRDGEIAGPAVRLFDNKSPMSWQVGEYTYTDDGCYWASRHNDEWDLVSEYTIGNIPTPQPAPGYSVIFGGAKVGCEPVPAISNDGVLFDGVWGHGYLPLNRLIKGKRIRIIEVPE